MIELRYNCTYQFLHGLDNLFIYTPTFLFNGLKRFGNYGNREILHVSLFKLESDVTYEQIH